MRPHLHPQVSAIRVPHQRIEVTSYIWCYSLQAQFLVLIREVVSKISRRVAIISFVVGFHWSPKKVDRGVPSSQKNEIG